MSRRVRLYLAWDSGTGQVLCVDLSTAEHVASVLRLTQVGVAVTTRMIELSY